MIVQIDVKPEAPEVTDGDIAVVNLKSASRASWSRFWRDPHRPGVAELIVEQEQLAAQFLGDTQAFGRVETAVNQLLRADPESARTALVQAQFASMTHCFDEARSCVEKARDRGALPDETSRLSLSIDQACGTELDAVLDARREIAAESGRLEDRLPLGALLADLGEFEEADRICRLALSEYQDVSPFAVAWVCFQLGALWGERVRKTPSTQAAQWYCKAIEYLPAYVKARVHLAEIYADSDRTEEAEALLTPAVASGDPEVHWRLADLMNATGRFADAKAQMQAARSGFEALLGKYLLAFADHGAAFFAGSGGNPTRAYELARVNLANRPTLRAFEQAYATATVADEAHAATEILGAARIRWGATTAFRLSSLSMLQPEGVVT